MNPSEIQQAAAVEAARLGISGPHRYDIYLSRGQSNDMGKGILDQAPKVPAGTSIVCETSNAGVSTLRSLADPFQQATGQAVGQFGSRHTSMANAYMAATGRNLCIIGGSESATGLLFGSSTTLPWSKSPWYLLKYQHTKFLAAQKLIAAQGGAIGNVFSGFLGGEGDAKMSVTHDQWVTAYAAYRSAANTIFGASYIEFITSIDECLAYPTMAAVRQAQIDVCDGVNTILAVPYQNFLSQGMIESDGLHWMQTALNHVGPLEAAAIAAVFP